MQLILTRTDKNQPKHCPRTVGHKSGHQMRDWSTEFVDGSVWGQRGVQFPSFSLSMKKKDGHPPSPSKIFGMRRESFLFRMGYPSLENTKQGAIRPVASIYICDQQPNKSGGISKCTWRPKVSHCDTQSTCLSSVITTSPSPPCSFPLPLSLLTLSFLGRPLLTLRG